MSVRETVLSALGGNVPAGGSDYVERVVRALEARDSDIADRLRASASGLGASNGEVERALTESGLVPVRAQTPSNTTTSNGPATPGVGAHDTDLAATVADLSRRVDALEAFGRRHGFYATAGH